MAFYDPGPLGLQRLSRDTFSDSSTSLRRAESFEALERLANIPDDSVLIYDPKGREVVVKLQQGLTADQKRAIVENALAADEPIVTKIRERLERAGLASIIPAVTVKFKNLTVEAAVSVGDRGLPSVKNSVLDVVEKALTSARVKPDSSAHMKIIDNASGVLCPGEVTLLLGPPGSGKTTLFKAIAGQYRKGARTKPKNLQVTGEVLYNGHTFDEFVVEQSCAYVSQVDVHLPGLSVRETLQFARKCTAGKAQELLLKKLQEKEAEDGIAPDPQIDTFMKAMYNTDANTDITADVIMNAFGLDVCADTLVGNQMIRGISGGQKKRVTTGEMVVADKKVLLLDEISTGLDSATTYNIIRQIGNYCRALNVTALISLLQPPPETYNLFDNIMFMSEGALVYYGPRKDVLPLFESMGFRCPPRVAHADFLQEVTSMKDQQRYWSKDEPYAFVPTEAFSQAYWRSETGQQQRRAIEGPEDKETGKASLAFEKYMTSGTKSLGANLWRETVLLQRQTLLYIVRFGQVAISALIAAFLFFRSQLEITLDYASQLSGFLFFAALLMYFNSLAELALTVEDLPSVFKQRDASFYPGWAMTIPRTLFSLPFSVFLSVLWTCIVYYIVGLAPSAGSFFIFMLLCFLTHAAAGSLFRLMATIGRTMVVTFNFGIFILLLCVLASGGTLAYSSMHPWTYWAYWASPLNYAYRGLMVNEFKAPRWQVQLPDGQPGQTIGNYLLEGKGLPTVHHWVWICSAALFAMFVFLSAVQALLVSIIPPVRVSPPTFTAEGLEDLEVRRTGKSSTHGGPKAVSITPVASVTLTSKPMVDPALQVDIELGKMTGADGEANRTTASSTLPFRPMSMAFNNISYYVPAPPSADGQPAKSTELQLLHGISGIFSPGVLTALMGASGAGKTTLMDVLAGRKTGGRITGDVYVGGYPKQQQTFTRVSGYVEQTDVHSPQVTVGESLYFSARMRLDSSVDNKSVKAFVDEIAELVELTSLLGALVGLPGSSGLSVEQRKRLTIAVELVANPSIVFMDEPTSGLDARAAAIVMRTVKNIVNTQRTVVCTIHQPSLQIFESFDELLLLKRGGYTIYHGPIGQSSSDLIGYLESIPGVTKWSAPANPANWMLEVTNTLMETKLDVDFAQLFANSEAQRGVLSRVYGDSKSVPDQPELHFARKFAATFLVQQQQLLNRFWLIYWRSPLYNSLRVAVSIVIALVVGMFYWNLGGNTSNMIGLQNIMGSLYITTLFLGVYNATVVQPVTQTERSVMYRERAANMYKMLPWVISQATVELPYITAQAVIYSLITYFMIGFINDAAKFFWFVLYLWLTLLMFTQFGILCIALTPNEPVASIISSLFYALWNLFSGFIIPKPAMPPWLAWCYYLNPLSWSLYGLIVSQLGDSTDLVNISSTLTPEFVTVKQFLDDFFGFTYGYRIWSALILLGYIAFFYIATASALRFLNYQNR